MKSLLIILFLGTSVLFLLKQNLSEKPATQDWETLFNGKNLDNWDTFLGRPFDRPDQAIFGFNNDLPEVFSVVEVDGAPALRISGAVFGGISTVKEYQNYHLQLHFKWGKEKHEPRLNAPRDSGLLYHGVGNHGDGDGVWLRSQEFQVQEGDCGDYWGVAGAQVDVKTTKLNDSVYQYDPKATLRTFSQSAPQGRHVKKQPNAEKPSGEWNTLDLYCYKGKSAHVVNGVVTMILNNSQLVLGEDQKPLIKGKIQLQSEGAEVFYRDIKIKPIDKFPEDL
ncbi:MAG TPA: DUF1080 domain-containing protein [Leeuwenhoekiella sp.]|nr:DUF1080 domain-containing protein [Leeuwenhoekiella sp.]